jgi:pimeloyl-ACP methyl ester carboxylesterase
VQIFQESKSSVAAQNMKKRKTGMGIFASKRTTNKANIVLVHGFWADGSGWSKVIPTLQAQGHFVIAEQNGLTSLADDVTTTRQILAELEGPTLLVGHSYGGFVISEAATDAPGVGGLVYISAFILDEGETLLGSGAQFPPLDVFQHLLVSARGLAWIDPDFFPQNFANDLDLEQARTLAASQVPPTASIFETKAGRPAWKSLPSWSLFGSEDRMIHPQQHRWMAQRSKATAREISASHVPMLSHPDEVAHIILQAANEAVPA